MDRSQGSVAAGAGFGLIDLLVVIATVGLIVIVARAEFGRYDSRTATAPAAAATPAPTPG
jgi:Tfp pilus assembly protein PilE